MHSLRDALERAQKNGVAIGHFNVADLTLLKAVFTSSQELNVPVLVGVSEGEREFIGVRQIVALVQSLREEFDWPIFLNADHTHSLANAVTAVRAGFDAIVFDLSELPFEQNIRQTKEAVEALKSINLSILVEGEVGDIGSGSEIHKEISDLANGLTTPMADIPGARSRYRHLTKSPARCRSFQDSILIFSYKKAEVTLAAVASPRSWEHPLASCPTQSGPSCRRQLEQKTNRSCRDSPPLCLLHRAALNFLHTRDYRTSSKNVAC